MRAGLSTIQQTLTPEAASVLTQSIKEAARRKHGQTTPLHVATTLLAAPSGILRQACIRSHPHSSHPLQCRALELCFSVALDRLPVSSSFSNPPNPATNSTNSDPATNSTTSTSPSSSGVTEPPISNALMAALKRAQANQRRGCPEQQQQPLLAVKVELEQLIVSILDDPSVSRVMREASFSSTAVKATIEQSLTSSSAAATAPSTPSSPASAIGINLAQRAPPRNLYISPLLHQHQANTAATGGGADPHRREEVTRVMDILIRSKRRNPVLVGDSDPDAVMRQVLQRIESGDAPSPLRAAQVVSLEKEFDRSQIPSRIRELGRSIEARIGGGIVLDLGDLKWLVQNPAGLGASLGPAPTQPQKIISEVGRAVVVEMGRLLKSFGEGGRLWLVGTATCATYLRCQVYHPTMENDWDLQAVPIASRSPLPSIFPRLWGNGILSSSVETLAPMKGLTAMGTTTIPLRQRPDGTEHSQGTTLCPPCMQNYEREVAKLVAEESEKSSSKQEAHQALPQWLKLAKPSNGDTASSTTDYFQPEDQESVRKPTAEELLKKWRDTCSRLHPKFQPMLLSFERPLAPALSTPVLGNSGTVVNPRPPFEPKLTHARSPPPLQMNSGQRSIIPASSPERPFRPSGSPVKTDLVLGHSEASKDNSLEKTHKERMKDLAGCMQDGFSEQQKAKITGISGLDSFKRLSKGLTEEVSWQPEAASTVATAVMQCKSGNGKRRSFGPKSDTWLLFIGPDKVGKTKMATALSELVFGTGPVTLNFGRIPQTDGNDGESDTDFRGRTTLDRVVDAIRRNPFSVVVLEDIDRADGLVHGSIRRAIERGRLPDSNGREVSLGSVIFILTADWLPEELRASTDSIVQCEKKILDSANCGWQLELSIEGGPGKRRADWRCEDNRAVKPRKDLSGSTGLSLDLNLAAGGDDDVEEGSRNSSDLTVEHGLEKRRLAIKCSTSSAASELMELVDDAVVFKPPDFGPLRRKVSESVSAKFATVMGGGRSIWIDEDTLDWIVGSLWLAGATSCGGFEEWVERVLVPSIEQLKGNLKANDGTAVVRLSAVKGGQPRRSSSGNWLPGTVAIAIDGH